MDTKKEEIVLRAEKFIRLSEEQLGTGRKELSREAKEYLFSHGPKDEKELETAVKRACVLSEGPVLEMEDFDLKYRRTKSIGEFVESRLKGYMRNIKSFEKFNMYDMVIPEVERSLIQMVLKETRGNQIKAACLLGINRNTLRAKIKKLGIKVRMKK
ncbi:MAG: hypothetical protein OEU95_02555 [Nitrospirota bacterium]|nr:hypothetical protein [Nitrospirota bacterium]